MAVKYKEDPENDDFMKEVMDLLGDWLFILQSNTFIVTNNSHTLAH